MNYHDYIIVGAGPAGLQMGYFLDRASRDYVVLEAKDSAGSLFATQPRHRLLLSLNKRFNFFPEPEFNLRHDWNSLLTEDHSHLFKDYSEELYPHADDLYRYLKDFAEKYPINIQYKTRVTSIAREREGGFNFVLTDQYGEQWHCARLLMATGPLMPYIPDVKGIELVDTYDSHDLNPSTYENKRVLVIGKGNSAFEVANHLAGHAAVIHLALNNKLLRHAWQTRFAGDLRAINNTILDMYHLKALHGTLGFSIQKITQREDGVFVIHFEEDMPHWQIPGTVESKFHYDHVICCTGWKYIDSTLFAAEITPKADAYGKYPILDSSWESSVPDMFFMGTVMAARDRQAASSFIHGFRYNVRTLFHLLENRYDDVPLPSRQFKMENVDDLHKMTEFFIKRISITDALYPLFGFLCDVLIVSDGQAELFYELPIDYVLENPMFTDKEIVTISLELAPHRYEKNASKLDFIHFPSGPECSVFLHGVFRHYVDGVLIEECPLDETLYVRYDAPFREDLDTSPWYAMVLNFINRVTQITVQEFPIPRYNIKFTPWPEEKRTNNHGVPVCQEEESMSLYMP